MTQDGNIVLTTECFENTALMFPFTILLMWSIQDKKITLDGFKNVILICIKTSFGFSVCIEFLQLFLRVGTFQISDIFYNTLGGGLGGVVYWGLCAVRKRRRMKQ